MDIITLIIVLSSVLLYLFLGNGFARISVCYSKAGPREYAAIVILWLLLVLIAAFDPNFVNKNQQRGGSARENKNV